MAVYRTYTYIAADWSEDKDAVDKLKEWNDGNRWGLSFKDAHDLTQARDSSLNCSIKTSLKSRLEVSKTFILIVGNNTKSLRSGGCQLCDSYNSYTKSCARGYSVDYRSFIDYECDVACDTYKAGKMKIVVLYNAGSINKEKCPATLTDVGTHEKMCYRKDGSLYWDYDAVKKAMGQ